MNKKRLFFLVLVAGLLLTCKNHFVTELLKAPSELRSLNVIAYSGSTLLEGGVAFEPGFAQAVREYTVYIPEETTHFVIEPQFNGKGTVQCLNYDRDENTSPGDLGFRIAPDEKELELILTVQRENLGPGEYTLHITRSENVPMPKGIVVNVEPGIGAFFLGRGVVPELSVSANEPEGGGVFSYQWFRNYDNNNRTGTRIDGATEKSYTLTEAETSRVETVYYYVEVTNNVNGKTGSIESMTRPITFVNKEDALHIKSRAMKCIPGGTINNYTFTYLQRITHVGLDNYERYEYPNPWETPGFEMGKYPVTWELWKLVFDFAEAGGYRFSSIGNQGAEEYVNTTTKSNPRPVGNKLHPVTMVSWNDCIVWCNAYSEMEGLEPLYRDIRGNILRDAREPVDNLVDGSQIAGKNGYRLPNSAEWEYAARGADPNGPQWENTSNNFFGSSNRLVTCWIGTVGNSGTATGEVGSLKDNGIDLYDMGGLVCEWGWDQHIGKDSSYQGSYRSLFSVPFNNNPDFTTNECSFLASASLNILYVYGSGYKYMGLRIIRDLQPGETP
jgi:formylglycine-generating enzyme required for sulfatase activity